MRNAASDSQFLQVRAEPRGARILRDVSTLRDSTVSNVCIQVSLCVSMPAGLFAGWPRGTDRLPLRFRWRRAHGRETQARAMVLQLRQKAVAGERVPMRLPLHQ